MIGRRFIMCTARASTTLLYHHNSGNVVRHKSPTQQCHQRLKSPGTQHFVRDEGYAILQHIRTTRLQTERYSSSNLNLQWHGWPHHKSVSLSTTTYMSPAFGTAIYTGRVKLPGGTQQEASQVQHADCALEAMIQTNGVQWLWAQQDEHICLDMITKWLYTPQWRLRVHRRTETNCNSILINKDEVWDLRFSQWRYWVFKYSALWWCVVGQAVHNVLRVCSAFIFMVKLHKNPTDEGTQSFAASGADRPAT